MKKINKSLIVNNGQMTSVVGIFKACLGNINNLLKSGGQDLLIKNCQEFLRIIELDNKLLAMHPEYLAFALYPYVEFINGRVIFEMITNNRLEGWELIRKCISIDPVMEEKVDKFLKSNEDLLVCCIGALYMLDRAKNRIK